MLYFALGLFLLAAIMGLIILRAIANSTETPKVIVAIHGILAASGLGALIYYAVRHPDSYPKLSIIVFIIGALGGFYLLYRDLRKKPGPLGLAIVHMLAGVAGVGLLLYFVFS